MTGRARLALFAGAVALPFAFLPLLARPPLAIGMAVAVVAVALASRSVVYPVALAGIPSVVIGLSGGANPLPTGVVTIGLFGWTAAAIAIAVLRSDDELPLRALFTPALLSTILLAILLVARLGSSLDSSYGSRKLQLFVMQNLVLLVGGLLIGRTRGRLRLWVLAALGMAVVSSLALTHQLLTGQTTGGIDGRLSLTQADNPILLGRDAARGLLLAIFLLLVARVAWMRLVALCAVPVIAVSFMAAGSRGPVVGLLAGLLVLLVLTIANDAASRRRLVLVFVAAVGAVALVPQLVPGGDIGRSLSIFSGTGEGVSSNGRSHLWSVAWQLFTRHPLAGDGTGSFAAFGGQFAQYPHNILLESAAELGVGGILLVGGLIVITGLQLARILTVARGEDRADAALLAALFASAVVNAMLSGDLTVNSTVWLSAGLVGGLGRRTGTLLRTLDPAALVRGRGGSRRQPPLRPAGPGLAVSSGRILKPETGATVGGAIAVVVEPARLLRPLHSVRLEWSDGGVWQEVASFDEQTFDLVVAGEPAAVVRSERLARALADAVEGNVTASPRRPWSATARRRIVWDSSALDGAAGRLRAVTRAVDGTEAATDAVALTIDRAAAADAPPARPRLLAQLEARTAEAVAAEQRVEAARAQVEVAEQRLAERERRVADAEALVEDAEAGRRAAARAAAQLEIALAAAERRERELSLQVSAARAAGADAIAQQRELAAVRATLEARERELAGSLAAVEERERGLASARTDLQARAAEVERRAAELAAARADLDARVAEVAARDVRTAALLGDLEQQQRDVAAARANLDRREQELAGLRAEVGARSAQLADLDRAAAKTRSSLEQRERDVMAVRRDLDRRLASLAEREATIAHLDEDIKRRERELAAARADVDARALRLGDRDGAAARMLAELEQRERELAEARAADLAERDRRAAELLADLERREREVAAFRADVDARTTELAERERLAVELRDELERRERAATALHADAESRATELAERDRRLAARQAELERRAVELDERERLLTPDTTPPEVRIVWPPAGAVLHGTVVPEVEATDDESGVRSVMVQRSRDGERWQALAGPWTTGEADDGRWQLRAVAGDNEGNLGRSETIEIEIRNRIELPAPPAANVPPSPVLGRPTIDELERLVASAGLGEDRAMELEAMVFHLRSFVDIDGVVPPQFDALLDEQFGDLLAAR